MPTRFFVGLLTAFGGGYCWTRALLSTERFYASEGGGGIGLAVLLAVGPLTVFFAFLSFALVAKGKSGASITLVQCLGSLWGLLVYYFTGTEGEEVFLLAAVLIAFAGSLALSVLSRSSAGASRPG